MNIMRALLILTLALLIPTSAGCASPYREMTSLRIDPSFDAEYAALIVSAADEWAARVPETRVPIIIGADQRKGGWIGPAPESRCRKISAVAYTSLRVHQAPQIRVCMSKVTTENFRPVVLHELGHAFARRGDHLSPGHIMAARISAAVFHLTRSDQAYVEDVLR